MSSERSGIEGDRDKDRFEIGLDLPFKPFEKEKKFFWPKKGDKPFVVPEDYNYVLSLRKKVRFRNLDGYIDIIQDDPIYSIVRGFLNTRDVEKPMGEVINKLGWGKDSVDIEEAPQIIRVSFFTKKPSDYSKLLQSYVDVKCGEQIYIMAWNINRKCVQERIRVLENGDELLIIEKNLFNQNLIDEEVEYSPGDDAEEEIGKIGIVWLPRDIKKLNTLEFTFRQFGSDDYPKTLDPAPPLKKPEPVLV